jgi:hypothetical protein
MDEDQDFKIFLREWAKGALRKRGAKVTSKKEI